MMRFFVVIIFLSSFSLKNYSQCCASGCCSPGTANFGVLEKGHLFAFGFYKYNYSDQYYNGDVPYDLKFYKNIFFNYSGINLSYGLTSKLTVQSDIGYFINKTQNYYFNDFQLRGNGLGDIGLYLKYNVYNSDIFNVTLGAGGKIPTGQYDQFINGVRLPYEVQSGSGAYSGALLFNGMIKPFENKSRSFNLNTRVEFGGISPVGYQFGIANTNTLSYTFSIYKKFAFMAMVRNEIKGTDLTYNSTVVNPEPATRFNPFNAQYSERKVQLNTGSLRFFACPGLTYGFGKDWNISVFGDIPFYQYYSGLQFAAKYAVSFSISKMFELHSNSAHQERK